MIGTPSETSSRKTSSNKQTLIFQTKMNEIHINNKSEGTNFKNFSLKSGTLN